MKNFTVKLLFCLCLLLIRSNAYAWYCTYTPTPEGWISNLQCYGIDDATAVQTAWCPYRNADPICRQFDQPTAPTCSDRTEVQSIGCQPHYSGVINQSRTYYCQSNSYSDWVTTSNNCTPDPPTCQPSTEERTLACQEGYAGQITETRSSSCPDPYGQPIFGAWVETNNSCKMTVTNVDNVASPISPTSVINVPVSQPTEVQQPAIVENPSELQQTATEIPKTTQENTSNTPKTNTVTPQSNNTPAPISSPSKSENNAPVSVPKGRDLVPGFGIVMSLDIINAPINFQQQQLEIALDYSQELPDGIRGNQEFLTELISQGSANNLFDIGSKRWNDLYRHYEVQPDY
jgi:hypothetical protein